MRRLTLFSHVLDNMAPSICHYYDAADGANDHHAGFATQGAYEYAHLHVSNEEKQYSGVFNTKADCLLQDEPLYQSAYSLA
jgi:hypothetical protein